ncbi:unnamed protein product, partial [Linum tenue]
SNVGWNLNELSFLSSAYSQQQSSVVIEDITSASATVTSGGKCSEEESLLGLSASLAQIVELGMEEVGSSPDLLREKTMKDVLARRKAPPLSPQERALRQLGVEGDVDSILMVGRPKRNGRQSLKIVKTALLAQSVVVRGWVGLTNHQWDSLVAFWWFGINQFMN